MTNERVPSALDRRLGQRVRARRLELGMSQEHLAELLGVTFQQVQKYEKGVNRIAASRLFDIAAALETPVARFFEGVPTKAQTAGQSGPSMEAALATPEGAQLMTLFASISSRKVRRRVVDLVSALVAGKQ